MAKIPNNIYEQEIMKLSDFINTQFPETILSPGETVVDLVIRMLAPNENKTSKMRAVTTKTIGVTSRCHFCHSRIILSYEGWMHMAPYAHVAAPDPNYAGETSN